MPRKVKRSRVTVSSPMPPRIFAQASPRSIGGVSLFDAAASINSQSVAGFESERGVAERAASLLLQAGFEVLQVSPITLNIAGSRQTYEKAFNTRLVTEERPVIKALAAQTTATFIECPDTPLPGLIATANTPFESVLEGVAIEQPRYFMAPSRFAPLKSYWHLRVPADVSLALNADRAHRGGITGRGVRVAMVDSGHYKHPYFVGRGYRVAPVVLGPAAVNPLDDESGHGTGESANVFAAAPDVELLPVKMNFTNTIGAFNAAVALQPDIITCSWGSSVPTGPLSAADQALAAAVAAAWAAGIVVIFSAGNGHWGFPGQHPDVISAGGTFMNPDESLRASDYASGFMSRVYPNRRVPDLCGLVGMFPKAAYLMLPVQEGDQIDQSLAGGTHPNGDETKTNDGWAAFSGTSAAAPQLAGVAALIKQACGRLTPSQIRNIMMQTARDVVSGNCNTSTGGHAATVGPDLATGNGLVDAHKAVLLAKVRCLGGLPTPTPGRIPTPEPGVRSPLPTRKPSPEPIQPAPPRPGPTPEEGLASLAQASLEPGGVPLTDDDLRTLEELVIRTPPDETIR